MLVAFVPPPSAIEVNTTEAPAKKPPIRDLPTFRPRWWYNPRRLDARPVVWSLKNHPEEWVTDGHYVLRHKPSRHSFYISDTVCRLEATNCDCQRRSNGEFQVWHWNLLLDAKRRWEQKHYGVDHAHFVGHFVHA